MMGSPIASRDAVRSALSNDALHLVLMPTEACNFRCTYCYEDFQLGRMHPEVVSGVLRYLDRRLPELEVLTLSWFGGEPLLALDLVEKIQEHVLDRVANDPRLRFDADMTTNAWLLDRKCFDRLLGLGVRRYQISLDGPQPQHDRTRRLANRRGTFDRIWENLLAMRQAREDFSVRLRLHVHEENRNDMPELIEACAQEFAQDPRFQVFLRHVSPLGGSRDDRFPFLGDAEREPLLEGLNRLARQRGLQSSTPADVQSMCYAARGNSFVVRADGRLNKCTVALEHPANQVGHIDAEGNLNLKPSQLFEWMRGLSTQDVAQLRCPKLGLAEIPPAAIERSLPIRWDSGSPRSGVEV